MTTINISNSKQTTNEPIVRMVCDCLWDMDTFKSGYISCAIDHLKEKHGGDGTLTHNGDSVHIINGTIEDIKIHNYD